MRARELAEWLTGTCTRKAKRNKATNDVALCVGYDAIHSSSSRFSRFLSPAVLAAAVFSTFFSDLAVCGTTTFSTFGPAGGTEGVFSIFGYFCDFTASGFFAYFSIFCTGAEGASILGLTTFSGFGTGHTGCTGFSTVFGLTFSAASSIFSCF